MVVCINAFVHSPSFLPTLCRFIMPTASTKKTSISIKRNVSNVDESDNTPSKSPPRSRTTTPTTKGQSKRQRTAELVEVVIGGRRSSDMLAKPCFPKPEIQHVPENELAVHVSPSDGNIQDHKFQEVDTSRSVNYLRKLEYVSASDEEVARESARVLILLCCFIPVCG